MAGNNDRTIMMEGVRLIFKNFAGKEGKYNREGDRNFGVVLPDNWAEKLESEGWNVKWLEPREEGDERTAYLQVSVNYRGRPPRVVMLTSRGRTPLGEDEVNVLDYADITNVDVRLNPYDWAVGGKAGTKAYLQTMYVTINEDPLDAKYADLDEVRH